MSVMRPWTHQGVIGLMLTKSSTVKASEEDRSIPPLSKKTPTISRATPSELVLAETLLHSAILWLSWEKVCFMHHPKQGLEKLFHFSGVCFSSPWVSSQSLHYFWNQSRLPGTGLSSESITTCLHQKAQGNTEDAKKIKESHPGAYFIEMCSVLVQRLQDWESLHNDFTLNTGLMWIIESEEENRQKC